MLLSGQGSAHTAIRSEELKTIVFNTLDALGRREKVLVIPPDYTRLHSRAGELTAYIYEYYGDRLTDILPALGTHSPMTAEQIAKMFGGVPASLFREHNWRKDIVTLGEVPASFVREVSEGAVDYSWPAQVNRMLVDGGHDLILSLGQVVPHEVIGMAGYNKNIFVGTGGDEGINKSHFIGAVYGMERIMGRASSPVRSVLDYASAHFASRLPVVYMQTVISAGDNGLEMRGLYAGKDRECFEKAAALSLEVNFRMLEKEIRKVVVYLDPHEFHSTWVGNKSIYRTRMAIADGGELVVLAPGVSRFGEDDANDILIRKYGYLSTPDVLRRVRENEDLASGLGVAAHLIHGSSEGRFRVTYCPGHLSRGETEGVGFSFAPYKEMVRRYNPAVMREGPNTIEGEEVYYISNPALGLWACKGRFNEQETITTNT
ncbi:MAG: lactate racemase domain-containing protein [Tannerellaceae bacterium]|jgi:nickel-dependent lactate racemase|nr:lactate racemase domain-containing protein [Tannerellaceae bacterium]